MLDLDDDEELLRASCNGEIEKVRSLLNQGMDVNTRDISGATALHIAAEFGYVEIAALLIEKGVNIESWLYLGDNRGMALHIAAKQNHIKIVELLIKHGANINVKDNNALSPDLTPLHWAAKEGNAEVVELLIKHGASVNVKATFYLGGIMHEHRFVHYQECDKDFTPLYWAAKEDETEVVELLIKHGASVNDQSVYLPSYNQESENFTPLRWAVKKENKKVLFLLLLFGADINVEDQIKIDGNPKLASCLAEFEKIKAIPLFDRMMKAHKGGNMEAILPLINNNREALIKDLQEIEERCSSNEQLSFIPKYLYDFMEYMEQKIKQAYKIKECKTEAVSSLMNIGCENIKLSPKLSIISKILLWIKQCFYKIMPFLTKNIDDAPPKKQCHNNNFHDVAENIAQYLSTKDLQNLALVCKDTNISVNNEKECSEKRINRSMGRLITDVKQVLDEPTTIGICGSFIEH